MCDGVRVLPAVASAWPVKGGPFIQIDFAGQSLSRSKVGRRFYAAQGQYPLTHKKPQRLRIKHADCTRPLNPLPVDHKRPGDQCFSRQPPPQKKKKTAIPSPKKPERWQSEGPSLRFHSLPTWHARKLTTVCQVPCSWGGLGMGEGGGIKNRSQPAAAVDHFESRNWPHPHVHSSLQTGRFARVATHLAPTLEKPALCSATGNARVLLFPTNPWEGGWNSDHVKHDDCHPVLTIPHPGRGPAQS